MYAICNGIVSCLLHAMHAHMYSECTHACAVLSHACMTSTVHIMYTDTNLNTCNKSAGQEGIHAIKEATLRSCLQINLQIY